MHPFPSFCSLVSLFSHRLILNRKIRRAFTEGSGYVTEQPSRGIRAECPQRTLQATPSPPPPTPETFPLAVEIKVPTRSSTRESKPESGNRHPAKGNERRKEQTLCSADDRGPCVRKIRERQRGRGSERAVERPPPIIHRSYGEAERPWSGAPQQAYLPGTKRNGLRRGLALTGKPQFAVKQSAVRRDAFPIPPLPFPRLSAPRSLTAKMSAYFLRRRSGHAAEKPSRIVPWRDLNAVRRDTFSIPRSPAFPRPVP